MYKPEWAKEIYYLYQKKLIRRIFSPQPPIYIFQMGKVGSKSLESTLDSKYNGEVIHAHTWQKMRSQPKLILKWRKRLKLPIYVICPIREPISRNISAFFQNFNKDFKKEMGMKFQEKDWQIEELEYFFWNSSRSNASIEWFDRQLRTVFGIDVLSSPFPIKQKWQTYEKNNIKLLVYRTDLDRDKQLKIVSDFLGYQIDGWVYDNVSSNKDYGHIYKQFCNEVKIPQVYLSLMANSSFFKHFWNEDEIKSICEKWTRINNTSPTNYI